MSKVLIHLHVRNFDQWRRTFDSARALREAASERSEHVYQDAERPDQVYLLIDYDDPERGRALFASDEIQEKMREGGVEGTPEYTVLEEAA